MSRFLNLWARDHTEIGRLYGVSLAVLGSIGTVFGMCFRLGDSSGIYHVTGRPASRYTRAAGWHPMSIGVVTAAVCIVFFAWPPLKRLGQASPLSVLRADVGIA